MFNRRHQILLNLDYVVEEKILRILTQPVLKNIEPSNFYEPSKKRPKNSQVQQPGV